MSLLHFEVQSPGANLSVGDYLNVIKITTKESLTESIHKVASFWYSYQDSVTPIHMTN